MIVLIFDNIDKIESLNNIRKAESWTNHNVKKRFLFLILIPRIEILSPFLLFFILKPRRRSLRRPS